MIVAGLNRRGVFGVLALAGLLAGCGDDTVDPVVFQVIEEVTFAASLNIDLSTMEMLASGVYIVDRVVGPGAEAAAGTTPTVSYTGWLTNGSVFDAGTFPFTLASGVVVPGFDEGITGMNVGGTRLIIIPPAEAYGESPIGSIPGGSILIFEVTVDSLG